MTENYWNKSLPKWKEWTPPRDPQPNDFGTDRRIWKRFTIGSNEYYGKKLGTRKKLSRVVFKIIPVFALTVALAPLSIPVFLMTGTFQKLIIWIKEVKYSTSIKYIIKLANQNLSKAPSDSEPPPPLKADLDKDTLLLVLASTTIKDSEEANQILQTLSCVSKSFKPLVDQVALDFVNRGIITIGNLPGIDNDKQKILAYVIASGNKIKHVDISSFELTDDEIKSIVQGCPKIESLFIGKTLLTDSGADELLKLPLLRKLSIDSATDLSKLDQLEELKIGDIASNNNLDHLVNLKKLTIAGLKINVSLDALTKLEELNTITYGNVNSPNLDKLINLKILNIGSFSAQPLPSLDLLVNLRKLNLIWYSLIPPNSFEKLVQLEELDVYNPLQLQFPNLDPRLNLKKLSVQCDLLQTLPSLDSLDNLQELTLESKVLSDISSLNLIQLEKLHVDCSALVSFEIDQFVNLKDLSIKGKNLDLPSLESLTQLERLSFSGQIFKNPPALNSLKNLKELKLGEVRVPFLDLPSLEHLQLNWCHESEEMSFNSMTNLKSLIIYGYSGRLPSFNKLHALEEIDLHGRLKNVPSLDSLPHVKEFELCNLMDNRLKIPSFSSMKSLERLKIECHADSIPPFDNPNLKELTIISNLKSIPPLDGIPRLKRLHIRDSDLSKLPSFDPLTNLEEIELRTGIGLKKIPSLKMNKKLKKLTIQGYAAKEPNVEHLQQLESFQFFRF